MPRIERGYYPASVMVWWVGVTSLHFCEKGVKTVARNYQRDILTNVVEPLNQTMFQNKLWIFQQDSAPAHKTKTTQQWFENHVLTYISSDHSYCDHNFILWSVLESVQDIILIWSH